MLSTTKENKNRFIIIINFFFVEIVNKRYSRHFFLYIACTFVFFFYILSSLNKINNLHIT